MDYTVLSKEELLKEFTVLQLKLQQFQKLKQTEESGLTEIKELNRQLKKQKEQFQNYINVAGVLIISLDKNQNIDLVNKKSLEILEYSESELIGKNYYDTFSPESVRKEKKEFFNQRKADKSKESYNVQSVLVSKSKKEKIIYWSCVPVFDEHDNFDSLLCSGLDITEKIKIENELIESEQKFKLLSSSTPIGIFLTDENGIPYYVNRKFEEIAGIPMHRIINNDWMRMIHAEDYKKIVDGVNRAIREEIDFSDEFRIRNFERGIVWVRCEVKIISDATGKTTGWVGVIDDITERKENETRYKQLFDNNVAGVFRSDLKGIIIDCNDAYARIFEYCSAKEMKECNAKTLYYSTTDRENLVRELYESKQLKNKRIRLKTKNNNEVYIFANIALVESLSKSETYIEGTINDITHIVKTEEALKESERTLSTLMSNLPGMAYRCMNDEYWTLLFASKGCYDLLGYTSEELLNDKNKFSELVYSDDKSKDKERIKSAILSRVPFEAEYRVVTKNKNIKWVLEKGEGVYDENNNLLFIEGFITDITERKLQTTQVEEREKNLKNLFDNLPIGIVIHDEAGKIVFINPAGLNIMGVQTLDEINQHHMFHYVLNNYHDILKDRREALDKGEADSGYLITKVKRPDGKIIDIESKATNFIYEGQRTIQVICQDVTSKLQYEKEKLRAELAEDANRALQNEINERKNAERILNETQKYTRLLIDSSLDCICAFDNNGLLTEFNKAAQKELGYISDQVLGTHISKLFSDVKQAGDIINNNLFKSGVFNGEMILRRNNESDFVALISASLLKSQDGKIVGGMMLFRDITERKIAEEQIKLQASKLNAVIESSAHQIFTINSEFCLTSFNNNFKDFIKKTYKFFPEIGMNVVGGKMISDTEYNTFWINKLKEVFKGKMQHFETKIKGFSDKEYWWEVFLNPIVAPDGSINEISGISNDVTEKKRAEDQLKQSLFEKEILLKEIHHRVKNNLQVISSILNLQSSYVKDKNTLAILKESQNRIKSMAFIHESLYQNKNFSSVNVTEYISNLSKNLIHSYEMGESKVLLDLSLKPVSLNLDQSIPCGLIINELVTNSFKYAFKGRKKGKISISLKEANNVVTLVIADDGVGMPEDFDYKNADSLGLQLVFTLVEQINGKINLSTKGGTKFSIIFDKQQNL